MENLLNSSQLLASLSETSTELTSIPLETRCPEPSLLQARTLILIAYSVNSLIFANLVANGIDPTEHPVKLQLDRIKASLKRFDEAAKRSGRDVDASVANRIIKHSI